jgi:hypothetical protein
LFTKTCLRRAIPTGWNTPAVLTAEAIELAEKYIAEKVVGRSSMEDCRHIAIATIHKADVLARRELQTYRESG